VAGEFSTTDILRTHDEDLRENSRDPEGNSMLPLLCPTGFLASGASAIASPFQIRAQEDKANGISVGMYSEGKPRQRKFPI
jgi:hypothetical protein